MTKNLEIPDDQLPAPPELSGDPGSYDDVSLNDANRDSSRDQDDPSGISVQDAEYHRDDLDRFLREGAWREAIDSWASDTHLDREGFEIAKDLELFGEFDFFWDDFANRVGYHAPGLSEDWKERDLHPDLNSWETVSGINAALAELGSEIARILKAEYVDWEAEYDAPDDLPDF